MRAGQIETHSTCLFVGFGMLAFVICGLAVPTTAQTDACVKNGALSTINSSAFDGQPGACSLQCIADLDFQGCCTHCLVDETGLSPTCAGCYAAEQDCVLTNCVVPCFDPTSQACRDCDSSHCFTSTFLDCSGLAVFIDGFESGSTSAWSSMAP